MSVVDGDIIRGVLSLTMANGDDAKNVFTWLLNKISLGSYSDAEIGSYVESAIQAIFDEVTQEVKSTITYDTIDVYKWVAPDWDYLTTVVPSWTSTGTGEVAPAGVAMLMTAYTNLNKVFGRKFIYGVTELGLSGGILSATALGNLGDAALAYLDNYNGGTMGPLDTLVAGVYSSKKPGFEAFNGVAVVKDTLSYQRRRKKGVGV